MGNKVTEKIMISLSNGFKAGIVGFGLMCILELLGIMPALYCFKGIIQPFGWLCVGWLAGYLVSRVEIPLRWKIVIPASLLAGLITGIGSAISRRALEAYLESNFLMRLGDNMYPPGLDPISANIWTNLLMAISLSAIGGTISVVTANSIKPLAVTDGSVQLEKKHKYTWIGLILSAIAGGAVLILIFFVLFNTFSSLPSGNLHNISNSEFIPFMLPPSILGGVAGAITYLGVSIFSRSSPSVSRRILSVLLFLTGIITWISVCLAIGLFIMTFDMM